MKAKHTIHSEWLSLIETSGPFLTLSMLEQVFPQGLETVEASTRQQLRAAYDEWREAVDQNDDLLPELHNEWVRLVLTALLEFDTDSLVSASDLHDAIPKVKSHDHFATFSPDLIIISPTSRVHRVFIAIVPPDTDLASVKLQDGWPLSLQERMTLLCRTYNIRLGVLTDGERWMLVNAPIGSTSSQATWYSRLWFQEPITLKAFQSLLGVRRCFGPSQDTLESLLDESLKHNEDVTETLGDQVKRAVEVLVQCLDKADQDRNRELLQDIRPSELYEAGLMVMMRLVFLLCAEERGLLLLGDPIYDSCYAITTLRGQLAEEADNHGPEVLDRRYDAWARLLALFRAVYGGIVHENLLLPALGGSLFDPDRFPFIEGRAKDTHWRESSAIPLPIDNRTVFLLMNSLQVLEQSGGALLLSYRTLDVEQIGHIYEGLLEYTVDRVPNVTIGLMGSQKAKNPYVSLTELESANQVSKTSLVSLIKNVTLRSESAIAKGLAKPADDAMISRIQGVCGGDTDLSERIRPFANLIRTDAWDEPIIYLENSFMVTLGADRHESGTHYTPKSLTETIVSTTLEPIVYDGPAEGKNLEDWKLKSPGEILDLKICDPAMGSGAFLVQTCRYLGERLVEAWQVEERSGKAVTVNGDVLEHLGDAEPLPSQMDERLTIARRLIAERCLYGVDINPLAVELAKLSIWLVTLAKERPLGFLDHNLRSGDSLLGINRLEQLIQFRMKPVAEYDQLSIFGQRVETVIQEAIEMRLEIRATTIKDINDVYTMINLNKIAQCKLQLVDVIADAIIGTALKYGSQERSLKNALDNLAITALNIMDGNPMNDCLAAKFKYDISNKYNRNLFKPFHWALEFPEIFAKQDTGFDAIVTNPPFAEGLVISDSAKEYYVSQYEVASAESANSPSQFTKVNLGTLFVERSIKLLGKTSSFGIITPKPFIRNERYWRIRQFVVGNADLKYIFNIPVSSFRSASVETCSIIGQKGVCTDNYIKVIDLATNNSFVEIDKTSILTDPRFVIRISSTVKEVGLLEVIRRSQVPLNEYFDTRDGINPGKKDFRPFLLGKVIDNWFIPNSSLAFPDHYLSKPEVFNPTIHKPTINGRDFHMYSPIEWDGTYLRYTVDVAYLEEFYVKGTKWSAQLREKDHYERDFKVLTRQTAKTIIATIDTDQFFPLNTVHSHFPKQKAKYYGYDCYVLLGLFNSALVRFYYETISQEIGTVFPQVHISKLKELPIPRTIDERYQHEITRVVKRLLTANSQYDLQILDDIVFTLYGINHEDQVIIESCRQEDV